MTFLEDARARSGHRRPDGHPQRSASRTQLRRIDSRRIAPVRRHGRGLSTAHGYAHTPHRRPLAAALRRRLAAARRRRLAARRQRRRRAAAAAKARRADQGHAVRHRLLQPVLEHRRREQRRRAAVRGGERARATSAMTGAPEPPRHPRHRRHARQGQGHRRPRRRFLRRLPGRRHRRQHGRVPAAAGQRAPRLDEGQPRRRPGLDDLRAGQPAVARRRRASRCSPPAGNPWSRLPQVRGEWKTQDGAAAGRRCWRRRPATSTRRSSTSRAAARCRETPFLQGRAAVTLANFAGVEEGRRRSACRATGASRG